MNSMSIQEQSQKENDFATKEYVQREHKETTRLLVNLALGTVGTIVLTSALMTFGFNYFMGIKLETMNAKIDGLNARLEETNKNVSTLASKIDGLEKTLGTTNSNISKIEGYIQGQVGAGAVKKSQ